MTGWAEKEDKVLVETILAHYKRGATLEEAFASASSKLDRTFGACKSRWHNNFQEMYEDEIKRLRKQKPVVVDYVGGWKGYEDEKFLKIVLLNLKKGLTLGRCFELAAKELGRSIKSCEKRWYSHILKRYKKEVNKVLWGKLNEMDSKSKTVQIWNKSAEDLAIKIAREFVENNKTMRSAFKEISKQLDIPAGTVQGYWYGKLYEKRKDEIDAIRQKAVKPSDRDKWPEDKQYHLFRIITKGREEGQTITKLLIAASDILGYPRNECQNMWYNYVRNNEEFIERYNKEKSSNKNVEIKKPQINTFKVGEFVSLVNKLIERNKELENRVEELENKLSVKEAEASMAKEFKENYEQVLNAIEKARQYVVNSELA